MQAERDPTVIIDNAPVSKDLSVPKQLYRRLPPISKISPRKTSSSTTTSANTYLPAIVFRRDNVIRPNNSPSDYLDLDLRTPRLNDIHQHLWLAGLPNAARPLHRQKLLGRNLFITQDPDEHLVWFETQLFIKPLPVYLLDYDYWNDHLCPDEGLYQSACGLLFSYAWLVCHEYDLVIAKETGLLPNDVEWPRWVEFLDIFLDGINLVTLSNMNQRYQYGELRLSRLNAIYWFMPPVYSVRNLVRGYRAGSTWYTAYFGRQFRWLLAVFAIFSVALSALQVGLATSVLQNNRNFENASYGFTIASLVFIIVCVIAVFLVWFILFWYHLLLSWQNDRRKSHARRGGSLEIGVVSMRKTEV